MNKKELVELFHNTYGANIGHFAEFPNQQERDLRISLLREEFNEYLVGEENNNFVEVCDALGDMMYIIYGTAISYGIPIDKIFEEIHSSNMSKLGIDGLPIRRNDGKILKGENYFPPNIQKIVYKNNLDLIIDLTSTQRDEG